MERTQAGPGHADDERQLAESRPSHRFVIVVVRLIVRHLTYPSQGNAKRAYREVTTMSTSVYKIAMRY